MLTKQELKSWTDALRSGEYIQGKDYFKWKNDQGDLCFCAIGLLCEVKGFGGVRSGNMFIFDSDEVELFLSQTQLGGSDYYGQFDNIGMPDLRGYTSIAEANDGGVPFAEIADHLDKYYPAV